MGGTCLHQQQWNCCVIQQYFSNSWRVKANKYTIYVRVHLLCTRTSARNLALHMAFRIVEHESQIWSLT